MNSTDLDQLKEVASIGIGNGATALSTFIGEEVTVDVPNIQILEVDKVPELLGQRERIVTLVLVSISGDAKGVVVFLFDPKNASFLVSQLTKEEISSDRLRDTDLSVLHEVANIFVGNGLKAVDDLLHVHIMQGVPDSATDMVGAVIDPVLAQLGEKSEQVLAIDVRISGKEWNFTIAFLADPRSTMTVLEHIKKNMTDNGHLS